MNSFIAEPRQGNYDHRFGGVAWTIQAPAGSSPDPVLVMTLDLSDPLLGNESLTEDVPICSRLDGASLERQSYSYDPGARTVLFTGQAWSSQIDPAGMLPTPFPESSLTLRPAAEAEDSNRGSKYDVQDTFLGGAPFLRIGGEPLWLGEPEVSFCGCGSEMSFLVGIGYENYDQPSGLVSPTEAFFVGELALYFFACVRCRQVEMVSQSS